jgi:predicted RNA-binding Zn-ribbon protein involved in translation (DUF1610 family)
MILALFKLLGFVILIVVVIIILIVLGLFSKVLRLFGISRPGSSINTSSGSFGRVRYAGGRGVEQCPSCGQPIMVGKQPGACPKCGTLLGRSHDGKLLIRIN